MTPIEKFDAATAAYLRNLSLRGKSEATVRNYSSRLGLFRSWWIDLHDGQPDADPGYADVLSYRDSLLEEDREPVTVRQYLVELKKFFDTIGKPIFGSDLVYALNPVDADYYPSVKKRPLAPILADSDVLKLLPMSRPTNAKSATWTRNYAFCALILATKIRNAELLDLTLNDLDFATGELTVAHGKGDKFRVVDFPVFAQSAVLLYLQSGLRPATAPASAPLFGTTAQHVAGAGRTDNEKWHRGTTAWLSECIRRHVLAVTGVDNVRSHDLRHIGARTDLNGGASLEQIQSELGHSSMNTTQIYTEKLLARRGRNAAREILDRMDEIGERNMALYRLQSDPVAV